MGNSVDPMLILGKAVDMSVSMRGGDFPLGAMPMSDANCSCTTTQRAPLAMCPHLPRLLTSRPARVFPKGNAFCVFKALFSL